ncbi:MAG TPA: hypothetical protein VM619_12500 [Luteimonas sp.]|nr:hypothetical protein [Luteimonas sp.]
MLRLIMMMVGFLALDAVAATSAEPLQLDAIVTQQTQIRADVLAGNGRYKDMPQATRDELLARQGKLLKMIGDRHDPAELSKDERREAFNTLEWIEATINNEPDERMVCTRERQTGSMRVTTVCKTQRQIDQARARAQEQMLGTKPMDI